MAYLLLGYPDISQSDYDWIQGIRKTEDVTYYGVVEPHFTIIFGTNKLSLNEFTDHVQMKLRGFKRFKIKLDGTKVVKDDFQEIYHAFLIPSLGNSEITALHDALYSGALASELRADLPYIPHIGIGTNSDEEPMKDLADTIGASNRQIEGVISTLTVVEYDGEKVTDLKTFTLEQIPIRS